jgi:hypothetical protein
MVSNPYFVFIAALFLLVFSPVVFYVYLLGESSPSGNIVFLILLSIFLALIAAAIIKFLREHKIARRGLSTTQK